MKNIEDLWKETITKSTLCFEQECIESYGQAVIGKGFTIVHYSSLFQCFSLLYYGPYSNKYTRNFQGP